MVMTQLKLQTTDSDVTFLVVYALVMSEDQASEDFCQLSQLPS